MGPRVATGHAASGTHVGAPWQAGQMRRERRTPGGWSGSPSRCAWAGGGAVHGPACLPLLTYMLRVQRARNVLRCARSALLPVVLRAHAALSGRAGAATQPRLHDRSWEGFSTRGATAGGAHQHRVAALGGGRQVVVGRGQAAALGRATVARADTAARRARARARGRRRRRRAAARGRAPPARPPARSSPSAPPRQGHARAAAGARAALWKRPLLAAVISGAHLLPVSAAALRIFSALRGARSEAGVDYSYQTAQEETEARRQQRWGHGGHHARWAAGAGTVYAHAAAGGRPDFLGYYGRLGLDASGRAVTEADIKRAFREAALLWHPDRQKARGRGACRLPARPARRCAGASTRGVVRDSVARPRRSGAACRSRGVRARVPGPRHPAAQCQARECSPARLAGAAARAASAGGLPLALTADARCARTPTWRSRRPRASASTSSRRRTRCCVTRRRGGSTTRATPSRPREAAPAGAERSRFRWPG